MKILYVIYQILKASYYMAFYIIFYGVAWALIPLAVINALSVVYHQTLFLNENEALKKQILLLQSQDYPFWVEIIKLREINSSYLILEHLTEPVFFGFLSLSCFIPLVFILTFHGFFRKMFYSIEKSTKNKISHLFEKKENIHD